MTKTSKFYCIVCDTIKEIPFVTGVEKRNCENCGFHSMCLVTPQKRLNKIIKCLKFWKRKGD